MIGAMRALDVIVKKRDGEALSREEIAFLVQGYVKGDIPDYQIASWLMSVFFRGMTDSETGFLTEEMIASGDIMDLSALPGPLVDKHSTGGVGDKVSLVLAPLAAACGLQVPMMSGRALGHTGGTLDKLESISGFTTSLDPSRFRSIIGEVGFAMTGQSDRIVPADRLMYGLRDVTGTVESVPLITASILSKKFAEGAHALIFDVKCGEGAFMKTREDARKLAESLVGAGERLGRRVIAVLTDMSQPLGHAVGNFLEVEEALACLEGEGPSDLMAVILRLTAWMLIAGGRAESVAEGESLCRERISDGSALDRFYRNVELQGGDPDWIRSRRGSFRAPRSQDVLLGESGYVGAIDAFEVGMASVQLGAGRNRTEDKVEPDVGVILHKKYGDSVAQGEVVASVFGHESATVEKAVDRVRDAYSISAERGEERPMVLDEISGSL
jgi:pyrimidine-nucleoside phosphorylase